MKIILDSNVIIAAFATRGLCKEIFELCLSAHRLFASEELLEEVRHNLEAKLRLPPAVVEEIIGFLSASVELVEPVAIPPEVCRDPKDLHILGAAAAAGADLIVTGDADLLDLKRFRSTPILSPRDFWEYLRENR